MEFEVEIKGIRPIIMHNGNGLDPRAPANIEKAEITSKRGRNRTASDSARLIEIECYNSLWLDRDKKPTIPTTAIRSCIQTAAKRRRQELQVKEGLVVLEAKFIYDQKRYGRRLEKLVNTTVFTIPVVNPPGSGKRIQRTRAKFDEPWSCRFTLDCDDELVDVDQLATWLDIAGRRIGLGDWRPEKSGDYGRFETQMLNPLV